MARLYRVNGSLSHLLGELRKQNVMFLNTLDEINSFVPTFQNRLSQIKQETTNSTLLERETLKHKFANLSVEYNTKLKEQELILTKEKNDHEPLLNQYSSKQNFLLAPYYAYKKYLLRRRINILSTNFEAEVKRPFYKLETSISSIKKEIDYLDQYFDKAIEDRAKTKSQTLYTAKAIIEGNITTLLGAIGEQRTISELCKLPDSFVVINDFQHEFDPPLHNKQSGEWIKSIQVDHIVIGPSGVFVIETKNWGRYSIQNTELFSPVQQVRRNDYAIFLLLNSSDSRSSLSSFNNNWGSRKISVYAVLLMINVKPNQEFQYVKLLSPNELCRHLTYSKPILNDVEVKQVADFLLQRCR